MSTMTDSGARVAVVTGGNGRLGRLLVRRLPEAGWKAVSVVRPGSDGGGGSQSYHADLIHAQSVESCFDAIASDHGSIGALIHAAGGWEATPILETTPSAWESLLRANLFSAYLCFRAAASRMTETGRLIAFAAAQGADRGAGGQSAYSAAKGGLVRLVESVGAELAERGITAHAIAPSTILFDGDTAANGVRAEDLVDLCLQLLSPAAGAMNGQVLRAYGRG